MASLLLRSYVAVLMEHSSLKQAEPMKNGNTG